MEDREACVQVREVSELLAAHGELLCAARVEMEDGHLVLSLEIGGDLAVLELFTALRYVVDIGQMRALCGRYGIEPEKLERLLPGRIVPPCSVCGFQPEAHLPVDVLGDGSIAGTAGRRLTHAYRSEP